MKKSKKNFFYTIILLFLFNLSYSANVYGDLLNNNFDQKQSLNSSYNMDEFKNLLSHLKQSGFYEEAIKVCQDYIKKQSKEKEDTRYILKELALLKYYLCDYLRAEKILRFLIKFNENDLEINFTLARVLLEEGKYLDAIQYFQKTKELNSNFLGTYFYLGKLYQKILNLSKLKKLKVKNFNFTEEDLQNLIKENFNIVIKKDPYFLETRILLTNFYIGNRDFDNAYNELQKINNSYSGSSEINFLMSNIYSYISKDILKESKDKDKDKNKIVKPVCKESLDKFIPFQKFNHKRTHKIRVGLNSNQKGMPCQDNLFYFYANNDFTIESYKKNRINKFYLKKFEKYKITLQNGTLYLYDSKNNLLTTSKKKIHVYSNSNYYKNAFHIDNIDIGSGFIWHKKQNLQYRGDIEFSIYENFINVVNILDIEEYLYGVVPSEILGHWPRESHKAQSILARSYALYTKTISKPHSNQNYDICSSQHCQVYNGISAELLHMNKSVDDTYNKVLKFNNRVINGLYHSNSGGFVQGAKNVLGWGDAPYLKDAFEGYNKVPTSLNDLENFIKTYPECYSNDANLKMSMSTFRWIRIVNPKYIEEKIKLHREIDIGEIIDLIPLKRSPSGNVNKMKIVGKKGELILEKENHIRFYLGLNSMRSTMVWIEKKYNKKNKNINIEEFIIYGGGWGHGVGMSQTGAAGMANKGKTYKDILEFYFPNTKIENI